MKKLRYFFYYLAAVLVIFLLNCYFNSRITYETEAGVIKPAEKNLKVFNHHSQINQWVTNFKSIETVSGNPLKKGSRFNLIEVDQEKEYILDQTVI